MKREERQNQMEELQLKSLNGTKTSENDNTFSQATIYITIEVLSTRKRLNLWCILQTIWRRI